MLGDEDRAKFVHSLEADGEDAVRLKLQQGVYGEAKKAIVSTWLEGLDRQRTDQRAEEALKEARKANWIAFAAALLSAIAVASPFLSKFLQ